MRTQSALVRVTALAATVAALTPASAAAAGVSVTLHTPGHNLRLGRTWVATATITHNGQPISGRVRYQMLAVTKVEATEPWISFTNGTAREVLHTPNNSLEQLAAKLKIPFTIHFEFATQYGVATADWAVQITG
jgi:hypothetical protein